MRASLDCLVVAAMSATVDLDIKRPTKSAGMDGCFHRRRGPRGTGGWADDTVFDPSERTGRPSTCASAGRPGRMFAATGNCTSEGSAVRFNVGAVRMGTDAGAKGWPSECARRRIICSGRSCVTPLALVAATGRRADLEIILPITWPPWTGGLNAGTTRANRVPLARVTHHARAALMTERVVRWKCR